MKTKSLTIAMMVALIMAAITGGQAQNFEGPCLPQMHGLPGDQSALCGSSQTLTLSAGINWVSFNVETTIDDLKAALVDALPGSTSINIRSQNNGYSTYNGTRWRGSLNSIDLTQMYMITVTAACEITLEGMSIDPAGLPITIKNGNNWITFPLSTAMSPADAFANFNVANGDVIRSQNNGISTYTNRWRGSLSTLEPGQGYMFKSATTNNRTLVFPTSAK